MMLHIHTFRQITGVKQKASSFVALAVIGFGCQPRWKSKILTRTSLGTVPETNSWPENQWLEEEFPFIAQPIFRGVFWLLVFGRVAYIRKIGFPGKIQCMIYGCFFPDHSSFSSNKNTRLWFGFRWMRFILFGGWRNYEKNRISPQNGVQPLEI